MEVVGQDDKGGVVVDVQRDGRAEGVGCGRGPEPGLPDHAQGQECGGRGERQAQRVHAGVLAMPDGVGIYGHEQAGCQGG